MSRAFLQSSLPNWSEKCGFFSPIGNTHLSKLIVLNKSGCEKTAYSLYFQEQKYLFYSRTKTSFLLIQKDGYFHIFNASNEKNEIMEFNCFSLDFVKKQVLKQMKGWMFPAFLREKCKL